MAYADVEIVIGVLRAGEEYRGVADAKAGGPSYEFSATVIIRGDTAEILGASGKITPSIYKAIRQALNRLGCTTAVWDRVGPLARRVKAT